MDYIETDTWHVLMTKCPHCGEVQDIDERSLGEITTCHQCDGVFVPVED